jgi:uncharacterized protein (TIGR02246 family)
MKRMMRIGLLLVTCLAPGANAQGPPPGGDAAVREVVRKLVDAREARDATALEALLSADVDQLVSDGTWRRGREAVVRGMLESSRRTGGQRSIQVESVRFLEPDTALADGRYRQTGLAGGAQRDLWTTLVLTRDPKTKGWRIAAIRNILPVPPAPAPAAGK